MDPEFWHQRWRSNQIGFHQAEVNQHLPEHWPQLASRAAGRVLVPLCGKSLDMRWLLEQGHPVLGVELSAVAVRDFFAEWGVTPRRSVQGAFAVSEHAGLALWCGDFFRLEPAAVGALAAVYDRAGLIALPPSMRATYAAKLAELMAPATPLLLIGLEYPEAQMQGPPFSVGAAEVADLFRDAFELDELGVTGALEVPPGLAARGLRSMRERVYRLTRR